MTFVKTGVDDKPFTLYSDASATTFGEWTTGIHVDGSDVGHYMISKDNTLTESEAVLDITSTTITCEIPLAADTINEKTSAAGVTIDGVLCKDNNITATTFQSGAGSSSTPSITFTTDTNTGLYRAGADRLGITTGSTISAIFDASKIQTTVPIWVTANVSAAAPDYTFDGDSDTGMYQVGANELGFATGGVKCASFNNTQEFVPATANTNDLGSTTLEWKDGWINRNIAGAGTVSAPSYTFNGDTNTGMYQSVADGVAFTTGGTKRVEILNTHTISSNPLRGPNGTAAAPSYTFESDTNTGTYRVGADRLGFSTAGVKRMELDATGDLIPGTTATQDIGYTGTRWKDGYFSGDLVSNTIKAAGNDTYIVDGAGTVNANNATVTTFNNWGTPSRNVGNITQSSGTFTLGTAGVYVIAWTLAFSSNATGTRIMRINDSGSYPSRVDMAASPSGGLSTSASGSCILYSDGTKTFLLEGYQNSGATRTMTASISITRTS